MNVSRIIGLDPLLCSDPRILILGTLPGDDSINHKQYYYSNSNRIWKVLCKIKNEPLPNDYEEKKALLAKYHIALWDYFESAVRSEGSDDKYIHDAKPNDITGFIAQHPTIETIAINGFGKYRKFGERIKRDLAKNPALADVRVLRLPETSGGNANYGWGSLDNLAHEWVQIFD